MRRASILTSLGLLAAAALGQAEEPGSIPVLVLTGGAHHDFAGNTQALVEGLALQYPALRLELMRVGPGPFPVGMAEAKTGLADPELPLRYRAILAYTQGELGLDAAGKQGLLAFVHGGRGFVGLHSAADSHPGFVEYTRMLGGRFESHPPVQKIQVEVVSPDHDALRCFHGPFEVEDEFYHLADCPLDDKLLLMTGQSPGDPPGSPPRPVAWAKEAGRGRVFYTILGHGREAHEHPAFHSLVGTALLWASRPPMPGPDGSYVLWNGKDLEGWSQAGPGRFAVRDGALESEGGMGLLWYRERRFRDFVLTLEWQVSRPEDNSGIFLRFPRIPLDPWDAVKEGYEVQICGSGGPRHRTGAIYDFAPATEDAALPPGEWNRYEITVRGQEYQVVLNGHEVCRFTGERGREGFIGLQNHDGESRVRFRGLRVRELP
jgi:type 1 glutamine amidotransferase